jgi:hypothetical protein
MCSITFRELTFIVHSIWLHEALDVAPRLEKLVLNFLCEREVTSLLMLQLELAQKLERGLGGGA